MHICFKKNNMALRLSKTEFRFLNLFELIATCVQRLVQLCLIEKSQLIGVKVLQKKARHVTDTRCDAMNCFTFNKLRIQHHCTLLISDVLF